MGYIVEISEADSDGLFIKFDYSKGMVDALKSLVPSGCRRYAPASKTWWVKRHHLDEVTRKFTSYGYEVLSNLTSWSTGTKQQNKVDSWFEMFDALQPELARKLFRVLAIDLEEVW